MSLRRRRDHCRTWLLTTRCRTKSRPAVVSHCSECPPSHELEELRQWARPLEAAPATGEVVEVRPSIAPTGRRQSAATSGSAAGDELTCASCLAARVHVAAQEHMKRDTKT